MSHYEVTGGTSAARMTICRRCEGLMVPCFTDSLLLEIAEGIRDPSWRCVNCGEWLDETIVSNRRRMRSPASISTESASASPYRRWKR